MNTKAAHIKEFINGILEFRSCGTTAYEDYDMSITYDWGREWAHRLTFRCFDN